VLAWFEVDCFGVRPVIVKLPIKPGIMETPPLNFQQSLRKILTVVLYVSLALAVLGVLLKMQQQSYSDSILMVSLSALAGVLFLSAHMPIPIAEGLKPDLYATIMSKVLYIGSSVTIVGILFTLLHLKGAPDMMLIGCLSAGAASIVSGVLFLKNGDNWVVLKKAFITGVAVVLVGGYFIIKYGFTFN
jgi:hypothetical protein